MTAPELGSDRELLRRYHEDGDLEAREQLIERHLPLVRSLARRYANRGEQLEDLVQVGSIGLIKAIDRFDVERGVELTTYATPNIIGEIKRHFRDKGWSIRVPRGLQELNVRLSQLLERLTLELGRSPTIPELAEAAGVEEEEVLEALESGQAYATVSLSAPAGRTRTASSIRSSPWASSSTSTRSARAAPCWRRARRPRRAGAADHPPSLLGGPDPVADRRAVGISQMHVSRLIRRALGEGARGDRRPQADSVARAANGRLESSHAHVRRAAGGIPLVLRVEGHLRRPSASLVPRPTTRRSS